MQLGAIFPQLEIGPHVSEVRDYALAVEQFGFEHLAAYDHVLGADPEVHKGWSAPYDLSSTFQEPFVLFGYLAAITSIELATSVVILPQRQTALVAKQAAQVDLMTEGRFRLGVGVGWNAVEYEALGQDFSRRGEREEEQIGLLRRLWTEESVTFEGHFDTVTGAGLAPRPVQRPIPIWLGGSSDAAYRRMGRLADGWFPQFAPGERLEHARGVVAGSAREAGRDPAAIGMEGRISWGSGGLDHVLEQADRWRDAGATHVSINTMGAGFTGSGEHLAALEQVAEALR